MSPYLCRISVVSGILGLFFLISDGVFAVEKIQMEIKDVAVSTVSRSSCHPGLVKFVFPQKLLNLHIGFRVMTSFKFEKETPKCPANSVPADTKITFNKFKLEIEQNNLLPPAACIETAPGAKGKGILCFYADDQTKSDLIAETNIFYFDTRKPEVTGIVDKMAANGT